MNPHTLFISISAALMTIIVLKAVGSNETDVIMDMIKVLGPAAIVMCCVLLLTRKYWKDARRLA